jgi:hypothetical protein
MRALSPPVAAPNPIMSLPLAAQLLGTAFGQQAALHPCGARPNADVALAMALAAGQPTWPLMPPLNWVMPAWTTAPPSRPPS